MTMTMRSLLPAACAVLLSACAQTPTTGVDASRMESSALYFYNDPVNEGPVIDQVTALQQSADKLVQTSTVNGALVGSVLGCGLTVLSASNARNCVAGAVVGGVGGAFVGNRIGERRVAERVQLVAPDVIVRDLQAANAQVARIKADLPALIARQEGDLNRLTVQLINNEITQEVHDAGVAAIIQERADILDALTLSAQDARRASNNLRLAAANGQEDLDWQIEATSILADDIDSARSSFSML